jgi:hypothetical protein
MNRIEPQPGYQMKFLTSQADIIIGGAGAGVGKTFSLLLDVLRYTAPQYNQNDTKFGAVIFRRETPQITNEGGLWDESMKLFTLVNAKPQLSSPRSWRFPTGAKVTFSHLQYESDILAWQGTQIAYIGFDELTHFTKKQFLYLLSRNRSVSGIKPVIRATTNPDPDSFVAELIEWWIDPVTGFPIPERDGVIRYFTVDQDQYVWGDTKEEVLAKAPHIAIGLPEGFDPNDLVKSITFIAGSIYDNKKLLETNPQYLANLKSQSIEDQAKLLDGNWKVTTDNLSLFEYSKIQDLFSNFVEPSDFKCITIDVAGFGKDLAVVKTWEGWKVVRIDIQTYSTPESLRQVVEARREEYKIPRSNVLADSDGLGWGLSDYEYGNFYGGGTVITVNDKDGNEVKQPYQNLKTQCYYRFAEKVNAALASIDLENTWVDGAKTITVRVGAKTYTVRELISQDLRAIKRDKPDIEGKKRINSKEMQKSILKGRSPDCGDTLMMRAYFDLQPVVDYSNVSFKLKSYF